MLKINKISLPKYIKKDNIAYLVLIVTILFVVFFQSSNENINILSSQNNNSTIGQVESYKIPDSGKYYQVLRVIDGDTFIADILGEEVSVRLIGIDTPEIVDVRKPVECFGQDASNEAKKILEGKRVRFEIDSTQDIYDKYGRLLAYVWTEGGIFLNQHMLEEGFAYEYTYMGVPYKYQMEFKKVKNKAKAEGVGLWAKDACK